MVPSRKRGDRLRLRNGECLDMNGVKYSNEYQYRSKIKQEKKKSYPEPDDGTQSERSHLTVIDGNVYQIRNKNKIS
jgi:hypothetical protein